MTEGEIRLETLSFKTYVFCVSTKLLFTLYLKQYEMARFAEGYYNETARKVLW